MKSLLPRDVYDVAWGLSANDFGVFQVSAEAIRAEGFPRLLDTNLVPKEGVERALALLERGNQWLTWIDRTTGLKWAIFPRWGDEQTIGNPTPSREPNPPDRVLAKCSLKTREFFAKNAVIARESFAQDQHLHKEGGGGAVLEGGEGVQGDGSRLDPELVSLIQQLHAVTGYPADLGKDADMLRRAVGLYGIALVRHVVGAWALRRQDEPLRLKARPRVELWNWFRIQKGWDGERNASTRSATTNPASRW